MADVWILVADHARARLFALDAGHLDEVRDFVNAEARVPGHDTERAPPPRVHDRMGEGRHAIEARTLPHDKAAARFADTLRAALEQGRTAHAYAKLVLIAPPRFLGFLNASLGDALAGCVALRIAKNLTRDPPAAVRAALPRALLNPLARAARRAPQPPA